MINLNGVGVALVTPFKGSKVNYDVLKELLDFHLTQKTDFLVILGSTAEAATLSLTEKKKIIEFVVKYIDKRIPIMVGSGTNDTKTTTSLSKMAEKLGADALLVVTPYYNRPTQKGLIAHYKYVAKHVSIPIMLYNVPSRTSCNILPETVFELSKIENIIGIKEASGDLKQIFDVIKLTGKSFLVYSGNDDQTLDVLKLGGQGVISVTGNIIPGALKSLIEEFKKGLYMDEQFSHYNKLHDSMFIETNPIPVKRALEFMGFLVGSPRLPLLKLEKKHDKILLEVLKQYDLVKK